MLLLLYSVRSGGTTCRIGVVVVVVISGSGGGRR